ncbi:MAG: hypothetical protein BLM47_11805 [Candidatus Reconcilbacillus cellulovorans]|uniref:Uncharacterized protein n=1 Tax=Candidatus Reconcilbacillus cellulovorans TaxID=1906605 RepID=A0A2A6DXX6_9BACL|nr:MAG: hypothetical protein BLM47_11805 [Candidatus Reconcilbacillus cellulovorans]
MLKESKYNLQKPHLEYYDAGSIEDIAGVFGPREKLLFNFVYEYLKLNPDDLFEVAYYDHRIYSLKEMEQLRRRPYDPNWCYRDVSAE